MTNFQIFISNSVDSLQTLNPTYSVEAEFGKFVVEGSVTTLAHHDDRADQPCPCLGDNLPQTDSDIIVAVSHFDLDCLGGVMRCLGLKPWNGSEDLFWQVAAEVDLRGPHKLNEIEEFLNNGDDFNHRWDEALLQLQAFWAWSEDNRLFPPREEGEVLECTSFFKEAIRVLNLIFEGDENLLDKGVDWGEKKEALERESFYSIIGNTVLIRQSDQFTNYLYNHNGVLYPAIVGYNTQRDSVTLSLCDPIPGIDCKTIAQALWGPSAGGKDVIAGGPRDWIQTIDGAERAARVLAALLEDHDIR